MCEAECFKKDDISHAISSPYTFWSTCSSGTGQRCVWIWPAWLVLERSNPLRTRSQVERHSPCKHFSWAYLVTNINNWGSNSSLSLVKLMYFIIKSRVECTGSRMCGTVLGKDRSEKQNNIYRVWTICVSFLYFFRSIGWAQWMNVPVYSVQER